MSTPTALTRSINALWAQAGELFDRAQADAREQLAQLCGRGAAWLDEAGHALAEGTETVATQLSDAAAQQGSRLSSQTAIAVSGWSRQLADRVIDLGERISNPRD